MPDSQTATVTNLLEHTLALAVQRVGDPAPLVYQRLFSQAPELQAQLPELVEVVYPVFLLGQPVPLTLGADKWLLEVVKPGCEPLILPWLIRWCRTSSYLRALAREGSMRHGPDGHPVEPVSDVHRLSACRQCERRQARRAARAAMMQAEGSI